MLIRCVKCGKPVWIENGIKQAECGYCYAMNACTGPEQAIRPEMIDWKKPLYEQACSMTGRNDEPDWLILLGDYLDAPQRLECALASQQQKIEELERGIASATGSWQIEGLISSLMEIRRSARNPDKIDDIISSARERETMLRLQEDKQKLKSLRERVHKATIPMDIDRRLTDEIEALHHIEGAEALLCEATAKKQALEHQQELLEQERIREKLAHTRSLPLVDFYIVDLGNKQPSPEWDALLAAAHVRRAYLLRRQKQMKILGRILAAACLIIIICYGCLSCWHYQPKRLETARTLFEHAEYEEAEKSYLSLVSWNPFRNASIRMQAEAELRTLRNQWAEELLEEGKYETAIDRYEAAGNEDAANDTRRAYAAVLEAGERYDEAILQLSHVPGTKEKVRELHTRLVLQAVDNGSYETAVQNLVLADTGVLEENHVTLQGIYECWGIALADEGQTDEAIEKLLRAGNSPSILTRLNALYVRQADEKGRAAIEVWTNQGRKTDEKSVRLLSETGNGFTGIDAQLRYWTLLSEAQVDLSLVYPNGIEITSFQIPSKTKEFQTFDSNKPLVFRRIEREYEVSLMSVDSIWSERTERDPDNPKYYTMTMLPELWQRLPETRRAAALDECTCMIILNQTYQPAGTYSGMYHIKDYTSEDSRGRPGKTLTFSRDYPLYTAKTELLLWKYPQDEMLVLSRSARPAKYSSYAGRWRDVLIDWTKEKRLAVPTTELGLAGTFDEEYIAKTLENCYENLLKMGDN